jgi:hypothetical protein
MSLTRTQERLLRNASRNNESGCWNWNGQVSNSGYGRFKIRDEQGNIRMQSAHVVSYEAFVGPVPQDMLVKQCCNNRLCINPEHLEVFDPVQTRQA